MHHLMSSRMGDCQPESRECISVSRKSGAEDRVARGGAAHYREQAAKMRLFASEAKDPAAREEFLKLAAEYDKLAKRAASQQRRPPD
jgi:hypothetical protein